MGAMWDYRHSGIWGGSRNVRAARSRCGLADLHVWHYPDLQLLGLDHGEWRGSEKRPVNFMLAGIAVQIVAVVMLSQR